MGVPAVGPEFMRPEGQKNRWRRAVRLMGLGAGLGIVAVGGLSLYVEHLSLIHI